MTFKTHQNKWHTIRPGDKNFTITDGIMGTNRAGFEISKDCPDLYKNTLIRALNSGWIKPIAHVTERELLFMGLTKE